VEMSGFTERYHRFYFTDIQAILVRPTALWYVELGLAGPALLLTLLLALVTADEMRVFWVIAAMVVAIFLVIKLVQGRTCTCHVQTAVQLLALPSVNRRRHARRLMERVRPLIEQAQGLMSAEEVQQALKQAPPPVMVSRREPQLVPPPSPPMPALVPPPKPRVLRHSHGKWTEIACWTLIVAGVVALLSFYVEHQILVSLSGLLAISFTVMMIIALVKQARTDLPGRTKLIMWVILGFWVVMGLVNLVYVVAWAIANPMADSALFRPSQDGFIWWTSAMFVVGSFVLSALALMPLYRFRQAYALREQPSAPPLPSTTVDPSAGEGFATPGGASPSRSESGVGPAEPGSEQRGHDGAWPFKQEDS